MYGIGAISHYNGWAMALAGALIVMSGLTALSFIISQLHKVVEKLDRRDTPNAAAVVSAAGGAPTAVDDACVGTLWPLDLPHAAEHLKTLTASLGSVFELTQLFTICRENDIPHPHLTIKTLRDAGLLKPQGGGVFSWN